MIALGLAYPVLLAFFLLFELAEVRRALQGKPTRPPLASYAAMTEAQRARYAPDRVARLQAAACGVLALAFLLLLVMDLVASAWALPVLALLGAVYALLHSRGALDLFARA